MSEKKQVNVILTLRKSNILVFTQFKDGRFLIIDDKGIATLYQFNNDLLERISELYFHEADRQTIVKTFRTYENCIVDDQILIARGQIFYMFNSKDEIMDGVLMREKLSHKIRSDYPYDVVNGPIDYVGQDQFIFMFVYKDDVNSPVFFFRQMIY